jgi:transposase
MWVLLRLTLEELPMQTVSTIGLDIAKSVFKSTACGGKVVIRRQLKRRYVWRSSVAAMPDRHRACASSHHWSRGSRPSTVRLMPPAYVKPYVKRQKNDATDAGP